MSAENELNLSYQSSLCTEDLFLCFVHSLGERHYTLRSPCGMGRPSIVCCLWRRCTVLRGLKLLAIFCTNSRDSDSLY